MNFFVFKKSTFPVAGFVLGDELQNNEPSRKLATLFLVTREPVEPDVLYPQNPGIISSHTRTIRQDRIVCASQFVD